MWQAPAVERKGQCGRLSSYRFQGKILIFFFSVESDSYRHVERISMQATIQLTKMTSEPTYNSNMKES